MSRARAATGRILSLGFPLPGPQADNYNFLTAPSFFDYDALVVDPSELSRLIEDAADGSFEATTFGGSTVRNTPEKPGDVALADVLLRRRDETRAALANGAVVVCFVHPATIHRRIDRVDELDDYYWLPAVEGFAPRPPQLVPADGTRIDVVDFQHPLATFVAGQLANIAYRAHFEVAQIPGFATGWQVFVRSHGGAVVGVEMPSERGRVIFLPALQKVPGGDARYAASDALQAGIRAALGVMAEGRPPAWMSSYGLPGLDDRATALAEARASVRSSQAALAAAERAHDEIARYQRMLWQEGALGLDDVVLDALRLIGFDLYASDAADLQLRAEGGPVLLEIEGSEHAIDLAPHYRLRQRIERAIQQRGTAQRGLLIVNGQRLRAPSQRSAPVTDALRLAAETMRYGIAPTTGLFDAVRGKLEGDDEAVGAYRRRLVTEDGLLS